jgi:hypothetical protein
MKAAILTILGIAIILACTSCQALRSFNASPQGQQIERSLVQLGLDVALAKGLIKPGQVVTIQNASAIITDPSGSAASKTVKLAELGIADAVATQKLNPGDALLIKTTLTAIQTLASPAPAPTTSAKSPAPVAP